MSAELIARAKALSESLWRVDTRAQAVDWCAKADAALQEFAAALSTQRASEAEDAAFIKVPIQAYLWLMGAGDDCFDADRNGAFWWRGAFNDKAGLDFAAIYKAARATQGDGRGENGE